MKYWDLFLVGFIRLTRRFKKEPMHKVTVVANGTAILRDVQHVLWPEGDANHEWDADTSADIANVLMRHNIFPGTPIEDSTWGIQIPGGGKGRILITTLPEG